MPSRSSCLASPAIAAQHSTEHQNSQYLRCRDTWCVRIGAWGFGLATKYCWPAKSEVLPQHMPQLKPHYHRQHCHVRRLACIMQRAQYQKTGERCARWQPLHTVQIYMSNIATPLQHTVTGSLQWNHHNPIAQRKGKRNKRGQAGRQQTQTAIPLLPRLHAAFLAAC